MSYRKPISFRENEKDLLDAFEKNGKSKFAKDAMRFFLEYKDKVITDSVLEILKLMGSKTEKSAISNDKKGKIGKLIK